MATMNDIGISLAYHVPALPPRLAADFPDGTFTLYPCKIVALLCDTKAIAIVRQSNTVGVRRIQRVLKHRSVCSAL
jgi:hypothetical protein